MIALLTSSETVLQSLHQARELLVSQGLSVLGAWAVLNILVSGFQMTRLDRRGQAFHFYLMNAGWGLVNALLAATGIADMHPEQTSGLTLSGLLTAQFRLENILLFNAGLDLAYISTGAWLWARAHAPGNAHAARLAGFGQSLWVQGGFLFVFDLAFWLTLSRFKALLLAQVQ